MKDKALKLATSVADVQRMVAEVEAARGVRPSDKPDQAAPLAYAAGFSSGLRLSQGVMIGVLFLIAGGLRFGGRKDRMLIHHFDLSTNGEVGPNG